VIRARHTHRFLSLALALAAAPFAGPAYGQTPAAASAPPPAAPATAPSGQPDAASAQITTIRTYSNLVVIDVVVTDSQGNPVRGLKGSDFTLTEDKQPQTVRHFEEHSASPESRIQIAPDPKLPPGLFTNKSAAPANGPVNVLLLDYLNTPYQSQPFARKQLIEYLDKAPAGTRIAVFALTNHLVMLQGFTSDMDALKKALTSKKDAPQASDLLNDNGTVGNTVLSDALAADISNPAVSGMITQQMVDDVNRFQALDSSFQQQVRAEITLTGFDTLARYLVGIPGRKNVIWFSGGFPLNVLPNVNEADPTDSVERNDEEIRKTDNLLTHAQVAVYPVDARGVMSDPTFDVSNTSVTSINPNDPGAASTAASAASADATESVVQEHLSMEAMAEDTGGHAFYNSNGLAQSVAKAIDIGSNYYTLTYSPTNAQWDERFRAIKIKVDQPNVKLSYREGYYAVDPNDRTRVAVQGAATMAVQPNTMATAMMHGGPDPAEIVFKVRIRPANAPVEDTPIKTNQTNPDPKVKINGPFKEYSVDLVPDPKALTCRMEATGDRHCSLEVWTFIYNTDGQKLITASNRLYNHLTPADYSQLLKGGMAFHQEISVPVKGQYYVRTAIHDMISDRVGAVEVPIMAVAKLEPLQALAAPATAPVTPVSVPADAGTPLTPPASSPASAEPNAPAPPPQ
jgi:VWFA-related protein